MKENLLVLGIETSCDETAVSVVSDGRKILSNVIASQIEVHRLYGGVVPEIAGRNHIQAIDKVTSAALREAGVGLKDIDAVAVTYGAGLVGALLVGVSFAKALSQAAGKPLYAVNHIEGHICANYLSHKDLYPPYICVLASGGHTAVVRVDDFDEMCVLCSTIDDAAGEAFDKVARVLGLPYPGGVEIDRLAAHGEVKYPFHSVVAQNGNLSYSGLKTGVMNFLNSAMQKGARIVRKEEAGENDIALEDMCASFNFAAVDGLMKRAAEELVKSGLGKIAVAGGVGANSYLRERAVQLEKEGYRVYLPEKALCTDNGAMIASNGYFQIYKGKSPAELLLNAMPTLKLRGERPKSR